MIWGWLAMVPLILGVIWLLILMGNDIGWDLLLQTFAIFAAIVLVVGLFVWGLGVVTGGAG